VTCWFQRAPGFMSAVPITLLFFSDATSPSSDVTITLYGTYLFEWVETNGTCERRDTVEVDFNEDPSGLNSGADQEALRRAGYNLSGNSAHLPGRQ